MEVGVLGVVVAVSVGVGVVDHEDTRAGPGYAVAVDVPREVVGLDRGAQGEDRGPQLLETDAGCEPPVRPYQGRRHARAVDEPVDRHTDPEAGQGSAGLREGDLHQAVVEAQQPAAGIVEVVRAQAGFPGIGVGPDSGPDDVAARGDVSVEVQIGHP